MSEVESVKNAIKTAIQMEKDGYSFYKKAAVQTTSEMGQALFRSLAADELLHLEVFQKLFDNSVGNKEWYDLVNSSKKYADIQVFPTDLRKIESSINPETNEIDALRIAMDSEQKAINYYSEIRKNSTNEEVNKIIDEIINQEKNHYKILEGEFHHINSTGYWFNLDYLGT